MKFKYLSIIFILSLLVVSSCSEGNRIIPKGSVKEVNTDKNELAANQLPTFSKNDNPCANEFNIDAKAADVLPSYEFLNQMLGEKNSKNIDALSFLNNQSGFFAVSHPPDSLYSINNNIPVYGYVGGTDIFQFAVKNDDLSFANLGKGINTNTWDSHPSAIENDKGNVLLIWSSDRADNFGGFSAPFLKAKSLKETDTVYGNSDLYYAFRINGKWTEPHNFVLAGNDINTGANEETPYIYCLCYNTTLLFASNRNNKDINDFDIYSVDLSIDFESKTIKAVNTPALVEAKSNDGINTNAKEFFPYVPKPFVADSKAPQMLYFSSDRFSAKKKNDGQDYIQNYGGYDIYSFPFDKRCKPPQANLHVVIIDSTLHKDSPNRVISKGPFKIELVDDKGNIVVTENSNPADFVLDLSRRYKVRGSSLYYQIECNNTDKTMSNYAFSIVKELKPLLKKRSEKLPYDTVLNGKVEIVYDTVYKKGRIPVNEIGKLQTNDGTLLKDISLSNDSISFTSLKVESRKEYIAGKQFTKYREVEITDTIRQFDTIVNKSYNTLAWSKLSRQGNFPKEVYNHDFDIYDTIYVGPDYFIYPPCKWDYVSLWDDDRRNAPYFQTGFWEVNTLSNLERDMEELKSKKYDNASFIELQPENQYFGYRRSNLTEQQRELRKIKWENRIAAYRKYAKQVDKNYQEMVDEISNSILPKFKDIDSLMPQLGNKLIIQLDAYSDHRNITGGRYLGNDNVNYIAASFDEKNLKFNGFKSVSIQSGSKLDEKNEDLSDLRAYFGYVELIKLLLKNPKFKKYYDDGLVLTPDKFKNEEDFRNSINISKVIILTNGRRIDEKAISKIEGYKHEDNDYYMLDSVRRINVIVHRVQYENGKVYSSQCCNQESLISDKKRKIIEKEEPVSINENCYEILYLQTDTKSKAEELRDKLLEAEIPDVRLVELSNANTKNYKVVSANYDDNVRATAERHIFKSIIEDKKIICEPEVRKCK